jgi:short-subunit dehydrogenase
MLIAWIWMFLTSSVWHYVLIFMIGPQILLFLISKSYYFGFNKPKNLNGSRILITGGSSGIGLDVVRILIRKYSNLNIIVWSHHEEQLIRMKDEFSHLFESQKLSKWNGNHFSENSTKENNNNKIDYFLCDVSVRESVKECSRLVLKEGNIDILINNAGIVFANSLLALKEEEIERTIQVNLLAHFWVTKCFLPNLISRKSGHIVSVSSVAGLLGMNNLTDYCARFVFVNSFIVFVLFFSSPI